MSRKIGVLVVHGIGSQKQGETLHNLLKDIVKLYPDATLHDKNEKQIEPTVILNERLSQAVLKEGNWQV